MDVVVRAATRNDLPEMLHLWREMMDFHAAVEPRFRPLPVPDGEAAWTRHLDGRVWDAENWCVLVAERDGQLVGQIVGVLQEAIPVFEAGRYGYVTDIVVAPEMRRSGVGQALFAALEDWFRQRGASHLQLQVAHHNAASQAFWRAMGCIDYMDTLWYDLEEK